jgi:hypothetical protein
MGKILLERFKGASNTGPTGAGSVRWLDRHDT